MVKKWILSLAFFSASIFFCEAQVVFESAEIKNLFIRLPDLVQNEILQSVSKSKGSRIDSQIEWNNRILVISIDEGVVKDLGIQVKDSDLPGRYDPMVKRFIERALLRISFEQSVPDMVSTAETMQLRIFYQNKSLIFAPVENFDELLNIINTSSGFKLTSENNLILAQWANNGQDITFVFPNNYQLITGKNKIELDEELSEVFSQIIWPSSLTDVAGNKVGNPDGSSVIVVKGSRFMDLLSSDVFYARTGKDSFLIFDEAHIPYSLTNLFLNKELAGKRSLRLSHKLYGEKSRPFNLSLYEFINVFKDDFQCYAGMEKNSPDSISGTVVFCHKYFNYINMLHFTATSAEVFSSTGNIDADLYSNLPMHNVSSLFKEYEPGKSSTVKKEQKIDMNIKTPEL